MTPVAAWMLVAPGGSSWRSAQDIDADANQHVIDAVAAQARRDEDAGYFRGSPSTSSQTSFGHFNQTAHPVMRSIASATATPAMSGRVDSRSGGNRRPQDERGEDRASRRGLPGPPSAAATGGLLRADDGSALARAEPGELARDVHGAGHAVVAMDQPIGLVVTSSGED